MKWSVIGLIVACVALMIGSVFAQGIEVPGDNNDDKIVSAEELAAAEKLAQEGKLSAEELQEIRHIHDTYPRTIIDSAGNNITIYKPIRRIAVMSTEDYEILRTLKCTDMVVAASKYVVQSRDMGCGDLYADGAGYVNIGSPVSSTDWEALIKSKPDIIITYVNYPKQQDIDQNLKDLNATVIRWDSANVSQYIDIVKKMGYLLDRGKEADDYAKFFENKLGRYIDAVRNLSENMKPTVYLEADFGGGQTYFTCGSGHSLNELINVAGGRNIFSELEGFKQVDPEAVVLRNPEIILRYKYLKDSPGIDKELTNTRSLKVLRDEIVSRPELNSTLAVKHDKVYVFTWDCIRGGARFYLGIGYIGKWLHPDIFKDYEPRSVYQEYLREIQGVNVDVVNKGVFVYPEV